MRHRQGRHHFLTATGRGLLFKKTFHWVPFIGSSSLGGVCNCRGIMRLDNLSAETSDRIQIHQGESQGLSLMREGNMSLPG